ncbi:hypothetical protein SYNTR_0202 [Candidatus Syntrophocurvum alkaliphilum]|uniref:Uncharacterized protein n=1 Tax=Candidatus Syntrophocurvum alkaliphilum TaxID=2293317 RepID=A0A6I6DBK3_9FIRM|nr:hypothetical protein SYNTR_0202 [Candidatus Syntrophocurvum alkaliphilum]
MVVDGGVLDIALVAEEERRGPPVNAITHY